jgi:hypothetical protein
MLLAALYVKVAVRPQVAKCPKLSVVVICLEGIIAISSSR